MSISLLRGCYKHTRAVSTLASTFEDESPAVFRRIYEVVRKRKAAYLTHLPPFLSFHALPL